nr:putative integron gene cassette protein [uncultured bacterium]CAP49083.1 putative integron gene cassette protein [uncultured bacterium]
MSPEILVGVVVAALVGIALVGKLVPKRMPPQKSFKCGRCGVAALHNNRTAEAWRNGKTKFFCQACHAKWLQSRPPAERERYSADSKGSGSGCFGIVALFALLPVGTWLAWAYV